MYKQVVFVSGVPVLQSRSDTLGWVASGPAQACAMAIAAMLLLGSGLARAQPRPIHEDFYEELAPYGTWSHSNQYGDVWYPRDVPDDWRPYSDGRWVWTDDYGWYWESDQPWGWAAFHYGRWVEHPRYGWGWVPGDTWGPAWVAWRWGDDYVGWAPLPPSTRIGPNFGDRDLDVSIAPSQWLFVEQRAFSAPRAYDVALDAGRNPSIFRRTRPATHYGVIHGRVINRGVPVERVEAVTHSSIPRARFEARYTGTPRDFRSYEAERLRTRSAVPRARPFERGTRREAPPARVAPQPRPSEPRSARPEDRRERNEPPARPRGEREDRHVAPPPQHPAERRRDERSERPDERFDRRPQENSHRHDDPERHDAPPAR